MSEIRYECALVEQAMAGEYASVMAAYLKRLKGLSDIRPLVQEFEKDFVAYIGGKHAVAVNSGSDALQMILRVLDLRRGDQVIIPDLTYQAVALAVVYAGARPVLVDASSSDLTMDVDAVRRALTRKTKAVVAAHMFGRPCDLDALVPLCRQRGIPLIEDVCQADSSCLHGQKLGSFGDFAAFSFSYYKPLSSCGGGGGMVVFKRPEYRRISAWMDNWRDDPELLRIGQRFSPLYFMDLVALRVKLAHLPKIVDSRKKVKALYEKGLAGLPGLTIYKDRPGVDSVPQNFVVACDRRDEFFSFLAHEGIDAQRVYIPLHAMKAYKDWAGKHFPVSQQYFETGLHLPLYSFLGTEKAMRVVEACRKFFGQRQRSRLRSS